MRVTSKLSTRKGEKINPDQSEEKLRSQRKSRRQKEKKVYSHYKICSVLYNLKVSAFWEEEKVRTFIKAGCVKSFVHYQIIWEMMKKLKKIFTNNQQRSDSLMTECLESIFLQVHLTSQKRSIESWVISQTTKNRVNGMNFKTEKDKTVTHSHLCLVVCFKALCEPPVD